MVLLNILQRLVVVDIDVLEYKHGLIRVELMSAMSGYPCFDVHHRPDVRS